MLVQICDILATKIHESDNIVSIEGIVREKITKEDKTGDENSFCFVELIIRLFVKFSR